MPIDPSIPLSGRPVEMPSILDSYGQVLQLQGLRAQAQDRQAAAAEAQAKRQREAQIDAAFQEAIVFDPVTNQPSVDYAKLLGAKVPAAALFEVKKIIDATGEQAARLQDTTLSIAQKKATYLAGIARATQAAGYDADAFRFGLVGAKKVGAVSQEELDALLDAAEHDPAAIQRWATGAIAQAGGREPETGFTLSPGQTRYGAGGQVMATAPAAPGSGLATGFTLSPGQTRYGAGGEVLATVPGAPGGASGSGFTLSPGQTRYGPGGEVLAERPAAPGGAAGGRNVTAGDARMQADYNTSRDDLSVLATAITQTGATGAAAAVGAALPKWVTDLSGWGIDAKKKQALIDRVKQVIGKTLEGGVLRKEDEAKYERILPTIGDAPPLVISKLRGLDAAIQQRQSTHLEALADAGYDVSRFQARPARPPAIGERPPSHAATPYKVGDILTVKGQKVRVTKLLPGGKYEAVAVP